MIRSLSVAVLILVGGSFAYAQTGNQAIADRKALMKEHSAAGRAPTAMTKGEAPFDLAQVKASLKKLQETAVKAKGLFPDDSKTGGETRALPVIWEKKAAFMAAFDKLGADAKAAEAAIKDEASLKTEWAKVAENCNSCHKAYRK
jgi:cytochrome c556